MQNAARSGGARRGETGGDVRRTCIICEQTPSDRLNTHMYASMLMAVGSASNPNARMPECVSLSLRGDIIPMRHFTLVLKYEYNSGKAIL